LLTWRKLFDRPTPLSELPPLPERARWDLVWGLRVEAIESERPVASHPVLRLTAVHTNDPAVQHRHALSECIDGLVAGGAYRVSLWVKSIDGTNVQLHLRDSIGAEAGRPGSEGEARYSLLSSSAMTINGLPSAGVALEAGGWRKVWADITTNDGRIYVLLGLLRKSDNTHAYEGNGEQLLFGGIEVSPQAAAEPRP
jgi:hypothetical protein